MIYPQAYVYEISDIRRVYVNDNDYNELLENITKYEGLIAITEDYILTEKLVNFGEEYFSNPPPESIRHMIYHTIVYNEYFLVGCNSLLPPSNNPILFEYGEKYDEDSTIKLLMEIEYYILYDRALTRSQNIYKLLNTN